MTEQAASYRRMLKSSSIIGGASIFNILIGLVRTKVLAVLLGPTGVGLVGLYRSLMNTGSTVATMGQGVVGARQIAEADARQEMRALAVARKALFWSTFTFACAGGIVMWLFRRFLAERVLGSAADSAIVGWLALGVAISVIAASQGAVIQGMRRIGDIARVNVYSGIVNTVLGIALIWRFGYAGMVPFVLLTPLASFIFGWLYVSRLPKPDAYDISMQELAAQWKMLAGVGVAFMGGSVASTLVQLWIRVDVTDVLGTAPLGQFQAAWMITQQYIALVLDAMAADYYPRLTGTIQNRVAAVRLVNEQTEIALLLSAPIFMAMMGLAPWVLRLLYTADFAPAVEVLRWQVLSDVLKVTSWPLGFIFLAKGDGKTFLWTEVSVLLTMGVVIASLIHKVGLQITGIGYLACYVLYLPLMYGLARSRMGFRWTPSVVRLLGMVFLACVAVGIIAVETRWGVLVGCCMSVVFAVYGLGQLSHMSNLGGPAGKLGAWVRRYSNR